MEEGEGVPHLPSLKGSILQLRQETEGSPFLNCVDVCMHVSAAAHGENPLAPLEPGLLQVAMSCPLRMLELNSGPVKEQSSLRCTLTPTPTFHFFLRLLIWHHARLVIEEWGKQKSCY